MNKPKPITPRYMRTECHHEELTIAPSTWPKNKAFCWKCKDVVSAFEIRRDVPSKGPSK